MRDNLRMDTKVEKENLHGGTEWLTKEIFSMDICGDKVD